MGNFRNNGMSKLWVDPCYMYHMLREKRGYVYYVQQYKYNEYVSEDS